MRSSPPGRAHDSGTLAPFVALNFARLVWALSFMDSPMSPVATIPAQTEARIAALEGAVNDIRDAVVAIARLEERHAETREALTRCFAEAEKNAIAIIRADQAIAAARDDGNEKIAVLKSEFEALKYRMAQLESRINPLEELRGVVMRGVWSVVGVVGLALVGLVLAK